MDRAIHALRTLFSEVLSNCGREAQEVQRPMAAPDRDAPPRTPCMVVAARESIFSLGDYSLCFAWLGGRKSGRSKG